VFIEHAANVNLVASHPLLTGAEALPYEKGCAGHACDQGYVNSSMPTVGAIVAPECVTRRGHPRQPD
jgi:hypothetical protein